jgi:hypothetical protein
MARSRRPAIPETTAKALYARSGNRCALCQRKITELPSKEGDKIVNYGKIAHINAVSSDGPRGLTEVPKRHLNTYENLILVCGNCHDKIDAKEVTYTAQELRRIKRAHEDYQDGTIVRMSLDQAESIIQKYCTEINYTYKELVTHFVPGEWLINGEPVLLNNNTVDILLTSNIQIVGGSGRGKSLFAKTVATKVIGEEKVPIIIEAIQYVKQINPDGEKGGGFTSFSFREIDEACLLLDKRVVLIVDGYNECPPGLTVKLNLWILAFANRHNATVLITTQHLITGLDDLSMLTVEVPVPGIQLKLNIAKINANDVNISRINPLLAAVKTGLEARLIGEIAERISPNSSRYEIFDLYARHRLGQNSQQGISFLSLTAKYLCDRITFSLSTRDFDRLMSNQQTTEYLFESQLLVNRGGRVYFGHELFFNAFSAEAVVRESSGDPDKLVRALSLPKHKDQSSLILGAIDDYPLLDSVLKEVKDFNVIASCLFGDCGAYAKEWAERKCYNLFSELNSEVGQLRFEIRDVAPKKTGPSAVETLMHRVLIEESSKYKWSEQETVFIHSLPLALINGKCVEEVFELFRLTDSLLEKEFRRLRPEAFEKGVSLRSNIFQEAYIGIWSRATSASRILANFNSGGWSLMELKPSPLLLDYLKIRIQANDLTNGQLYLLLELVRLLGFRHPEWKGLIAPVLPRWLSEPWKFYPYHLKNALLDAAHYSDGMTIEQREELIRVLEGLLEIERGNFMLPTSIFEALQSLGALEKDELEYQEVVRAELANIFSEENGRVNREDAFAFYQKTFDHPYMGAYCEILNELSQPDVKKLYNMSVKGAATREYTFGLPYALYRLAVFEDPTTADSFLPFIRLPFKQANMPQEAVETFKLAHIVLGWMGKAISFSHNTILDPPSAALKAYGEIIYWLNRRDLIVDRRIQYTSKAWDVLLDHDKGASAGVLMICNDPSHAAINLLSRDRDVITHVRSMFAEYVADIYRAAITRPAIQKEYFRWDKTAEILTHCIAGLSDVGTLFDIPLLKQYTDSQNGGPAIKAIHSIEKRFREQNLRNK